MSFYEKDTGMSKCILPFSFGDGQAVFGGKVGMSLFSVGYSGMIDDVTVYNRALTDDEVRDMVVVESDLENRECEMVESESFLDSTRKMVVSWLERGWWMVGKWLSRSSEEWMNCDWEMAGYGWSTDGVMTKGARRLAALFFIRPAPLRD